MTSDRHRYERIYAVAAWAFVLIAIAVRVGLYLRNRALWLDEVMLAMNVVERSIGELFQPLDYNQSAPLGFLLVAKLATIILGQNDWVLRAVPLAAGIAAAPLFLLTAQRALVSPLAPLRNNYPSAVEVTTNTVPHATTAPAVSQSNNVIVVADEQHMDAYDTPMPAQTATLDPIAVGANHTDWQAVLYTLALFAISFPLVRYASEFKQYAYDLAASAAILWLALRLWAAPASIARAAALTAAGAVLLWFSHPLLFVLAAVGAVTAVRFAVARDGRALVYLLAIGAIWAASFGLSYLVSLRHYAGDTELTAWWEHAFLPFPPHSPADVKWFFWTFVAVFEHPLGLLLPGLGALAFLLGCVTLAQSRPWVLALVLAPIIVALAASALRLYPFTERFIIFLAPSLIIVTGAGIHYVVHALWPRARIAAALFVALLFLQPALVLANELAQPGDPGVRPALAQLAQSESDAPIYVYHWAQYEVRYYASAYGIDSDRFIVGSTARNEWNHYAAELEKLRGTPEVWFLFVDVPFFLGRNEEQYMLTVLDDWGTRSAEHHSPRARLYRYDLSPQEPQPETTTP